MKRARLVLLVAVLGGVLVVGSAAYWWVRPRVLTSESGTKVMVSGFAEDSTDDVISGTLRIVGTDCLGIVSDSSSVAVVWPFGTRIASDNPLVIVYQGRIFVMGQKVTGGGNTNTQPGRFSAPDPPKECGDGKRWALVDVR